MNKKRDRLQVIYDILKVIKEKNGRIKPTHILYKSNLSHQMMDEYLRELL
jgi:predicted transcriptional regulator